MYKRLISVVFCGAIIRNEVIMYYYFFEQNTLLNGTGYGYCNFHLWHFLFNQYFTFIQSILHKLCVHAMPGGLTRFLVIK